MNRLGADILASLSCAHRNSWMIWKEKSVGIEPKADLILRKAFITYISGFYNLYFAP